MNNRPLFLFGNGLSMAVSSDFSLKNITTKFIEELEGDEKEFLLVICGGSDNISFDDFEKNFTAIEAAYSSLKRYRGFIESEVGQKMLMKFNLSNPNLDAHEIIIESIYRKYIARILELVHGNVRLKKIEERLNEFTQFFISCLNECQKGYVFTLNYDLLAETILLEWLGTKCFTDFCFPAGTSKKDSLSRYYFNPARNEDYYDEDQRRIELHHLHGSLSLFYDIDKNRAFKYKSEDIGIEEIYKQIYNENLPLVPAIITGGGKSEKIVEYPFDFYYRALKDLCDFGQPSKLFIVGYSFRDEHINDLIIRWAKNVEDYSDGLLIIDFKTKKSDKEEFKKFVRKALKKKSAIPDECFEFGGANSIRDVPGTKPREKNSKTI
ncbi:hypothetical protein OXPF_37620 [Oxobacter pfennigii]|uniref:Uncharacterized protein n=1 Tax=Oxobacter pfennigii TaxID=36849 RepID=A0A0P8W2H8_9CLOT|nr:SIR2 family protein [Oxobacter pfennigii]KPU42708.1 hypothetical protein OXPF_37620 [Oxobacter pfennigii]